MSLGVRVDEETPPGCTHTSPGRAERDRVLGEKTLMLGGIGGRRKRGQQRMRWLDGITDSTDVFL